MIRPKAKLVLAFFLLTLFTFLGCTRKEVDNSLHLVLTENPKSLDPIQGMDVLAAYAMGNVYEPLFQYHYLRRPYELIPLLSEGMPQYSKDGLTVTIKIKQKTFFQDDPCFPNGKGRELIAQDFIFAFKRLADPKNQSDGWWIFDQKIVGFDEWRAEAVKTGKADYSKNIEGLLTPASHTLVFKLKKPYPQLSFVLATVYAAPVPHEAVEKYGAEFANHPVGTGPYVMKEYVRSSQIIFERNPTFRGENFPQREDRLPASCDDKEAKKKPSFLETCGSPKATDKVAATSSSSASPQSSAPPIATDLDYGKPLPLTDRLVIHIFLEKNPAWLEFMKGHVDVITLPKDNFSEVIGTDREIKPELVSKGMRLSKDESTTEWFIGYNLEDPLVGKNKFLRKAISLAYNSQRDIDLFTNGIAKPANQILPPTIKGHVASLPPREFDVAKAKEFLVRAGYPGGKGLPTLYYDVEASSEQRQRGEFFKSQMAEIGIKVEVRMNTRPEYFDRRKKGKVQIQMDGWIADYPDAENFMQLLYGPNKRPGPNNSSFNNAEFNKLYEEMAALPANSGERQKKIARMTEIFLEESPWTPNWVATLYHLHQGWIKNYVYSDFAYNTFKYYRVDFDKKKELQTQF